MKKFVVLEYLRKNGKIVALHYVADNYDDAFFFANDLVERRFEPAKRICIRCVDNVETCYPSCNSYIYRVE